MDADLTNFRDLLDRVVDKFPGYGDIVRLFYFCMDSKVNIQVSSDQDLVEMFAKHKATKVCYLTICYHSPSIEPPAIPDWDFGTTIHCVQPPPPMIPSVACPSIAEPNHATHTQFEESDCLVNPNPMNEFVGVDEEGLYIDLGPQHPPPPPPMPLFEGGQDGACSETDDESESEDEPEVESLCRDNTVLGVPPGG